MSRRFLELAIRARRLVTAAPRGTATAVVRPSARRQVGRTLTQFSFRMAIVVELASVGVGALGGAAISRTALRSNDPPPAACAAAPSGHRRH